MLYLGNFDYFWDSVEGENRRCASCEGGGCMVVVVGFMDGKRCNHNTVQQLWLGKLMELSGGSRDRIRTPTATLLQLIVYCPSVHSEIGSIM